MSNSLKTFGIIGGTLLGIFLIASCAGLVYLGDQAPETSIYTGRQIPQKYLDIVQELNLIEPDEEIRFFIQMRCSTLRKDSISSRISTWCCIPQSGPNLKPLSLLMKLRT